MAQIKDLPPLPVYNGTSKSDGVIVPLLQSGVWSAIIGLAGFFGMLLLYWVGKDMPLGIGEWIVMILGGWWFKLAVTAGVIGFFVTAVIEWPARRNHWMWMWERVWRVDVDGDGEIGEPHTPQLEYIVRDPDSQHINVMSLPYPERIVEVARAIVEDGSPFTHEEWVGSRNLFSRTEWDALTHEMSRRGLIEKSGRNVNSPWRFTAAGWNFLEAAAQDWVRIKSEVRIGGTHSPIREMQSTSPTAPEWHKWGM